MTRDRLTRFSEVVQTTKKGETITRYGRRWSSSHPLRNDTRESFRFSTRSEKRERRMVRKSFLSISSGRSLLRNSD